MYDSDGARQPKHAIWSALESAGTRSPRRATGWAKENSLGTVTGPPPRFGSVVRRRLLTESSSARLRHLLLHVSPSPHRRHRLTQLLLPPLSRLSSLALLLGTLFLCLHAIRPRYPDNQSPTRNSHRCKPAFLILSLAQGQAAISQHRHCRARGRRQLRGGP